MALGASLTFAYAPFDVWWLPFVVLPTWLALSAKFAKHAFHSGWWFGLGFFGAGISWVHVSIATFGGVPLVVSILMMVLLCGYLALYCGLFIFILKRYFHLALWPLAAPAIWLATEFLRGSVLTGFPWLSVGYSQTNSWFRYLYPIVGEIGVSAVMILLSSTVAIAIVLRTRQAVITSFVVVLVCVISTWSLKGWQWSVPTGESRSFALVQGNIEQSMRWRPEQDRPTMEKYLRLSESTWGSDVIIWPEAAIPRLEPLAQQYIADIDQRATESGSALLTGIVNYNYETDAAFNSIISLGLDTQTEQTYAYRYMHRNRFSKHHLLPIGEFVPFESLLRPLAPIFDLPMSSFTRGDYVQPNLLAKGLHGVPAICFEIAFPRQIRANITDESDFILTVSNDAWFGDSHGPHQHLQIAQVRAMEFALPVIRATNNGITAAYDHKGRLLGILPQFEEGVLKLTLALVNGSTPYTLAGNIPIYFVSLFGLGIAFLVKRTQRTDDALRN
ncbi:apolipoprotein N-acyltransferase [Glaciecola sp. XM2]|uniref:apolipoprotein N-acyltransferase n=1 Tax=Glaciecola sp. XM2 TaxID=1914931 RepID=UPI0020323BA9|nr:apolipoprotein N-acyltransferase [Glaciecola sp. XM2]